MVHLTKNEIDEIICDYNIDVDSTTQVKVSNLKDSTKIFRVDRSDLNCDVFLIDTLSGKNIACYPHIIGKSLKNQAFDAALEAAKAINQITNLSSENQDSIVIENVLRGGPGYELHPAFRTINAGKGFKDVWIRLKYEKISYRIHDSETISRLNIIYEDFEELPRNKEIILLKPDTEATGKTGQKSIDRTIQMCEKIDSTIKKIILYGFISINGLKSIYETVRNYGIQLVAFSIGNLTELAHNNYDMTMYGIDESLWKALGDIKKLGSIVDYKTLERYIPHFIPGLDQPGDWSDRHTSVYVTKDKKEKINHVKHLSNSINIIENLRKISNFKLWQKQIAEKELHMLNSNLKKLKG